MDGATSTRVPNDTQAYRRRAMTCLRSLSVQKCRVYSPRSEFPRERKGVWGAESPTPVTGGHPGGGAGCGACQSGAWLLGTCLFKNLYLLPN